MKKIWGRKVLGFAVGVCLLLTMICQNVAFVSAEPEEKTVVVNFEESLNETMSKTIEILNLFDISEIVVDSGKVSYSREGDKVTVTVSEGVYRVGPHTQNVTLTIEDDKGIFDEKTNLSDNCLILSATLVISSGVIFICISTFAPLLQNEYDVIYENYTISYF